MNYSDNKKPQIDVSNYYPEVIRSDINLSLANNVFNRLFSKDDNINVSGYVGNNNPNVDFNNKILEISSDSHEQAHRRAFQLAPTMYSKVGTVETALSYRHFLTQLELQGVDIDRLAKWGSSIEFNWVPPINLDMLVNYQDYYWTDSNINTLPNYLTIENRCNKASDRITAFENSIKQRGLNLEIIDFNVPTKTFVFNGDVTNIFTNNYRFSVTTSTVNHFIGKSWKVVSSDYNEITDQTNVVVSTAIIPTTQPPNPIVGSLWYTASTVKIWDSSEWVTYTEHIVSQVVIPGIFSVKSVSILENTFVIGGKQDDLFIPEFVFYTTNSVNINFQNKFWTVLSSSFDVNSYTTTITVLESLVERSATPPAIVVVGLWWYDTTNNELKQWDGAQWINTSNNVILDISLSEVLATLRVDVNCKCGVTKGWDIGQWDDNSLGNIAWNTALLQTISFNTEQDWIDANPSQVDINNFPQINSIWYDISTNQLKQYGDPVHPNPNDLLYTPSWNVVASNFSVILTLTTAKENWDESVGCDIQQLNSWSSINKWKHKTAVQNYATAKRAQIPILEYDSVVELNEWSEVVYNWKYRKSVNDEFKSTSSSPNRLELEPVKGYRAVHVSGIWVLYLGGNQSTMNINVDLTSVFIPGYKFKIVNDTGADRVYTVRTSEFKSMNNALFPAEVQGEYFSTVVTIVETTFTSPVNGEGDNIRIIPVKTSQQDPWGGYHTHWMLDLSNIQYRPAGSQPLNISKELYPEVTELVAGNVAYTGFVPQIKEITFGKTFQSFVVTKKNIVDIDLVPSLQYRDTTPSYYTIKDSNNLRVYVNDVRQYGTYIERVGVDNPSYTLVGHDITPDIKINYVIGITFTDRLLKIGDVVRIEVGPASIFDMGRYAVPVRTVENDLLFDEHVASNQQPVYMDLSRFIHSAQVKRSVNEYPLFNVYDIITSELIDASSIFSYKENTSSNINGYLQRRLDLTSGGFEFEQHLISENNGILYGYRNVSKVRNGMYWFNPVTNTIKRWDGKTWSSSVIVSTVDGLAVREFTVNATEPTVNVLDQTIWFNTTVNKLYVRTGSSWVENPDIIVIESDPSLQTIWRCGINKDMYVPRYVNEDNNITTIGDINGYWEIVKQWFYNPDHQNKTSVTLAQLTPHFNSIIQNQPKIVGVNNISSVIQSDINYGLGGTIKEFNSSFDMLISAVNVNNVTPIGVMEFAAREYISNLRFVRELFNRNIVDFLINYDSSNKFIQYMVDRVISTYEDNDYMSSLYGDTTAYDNVSKKGIRNWIATAPMLGLTPIYKPHLIRGNDFIQLFHHDGHRANIEYRSNEVDSVARKLLKTIDNRVPSHYIGVLGTTVPPVTEMLFTSYFGGDTIRSNVYWYHLIGNKSLYRLEVYAISDVAPSMYENGVQLPNGVYYYNTSSHNVYKKQGLVWTLVTPVMSFDISPLWKLVDIKEILSEVYLEIENRLYDVGQLTSGLIFDYNMLQDTPSDILVYNTKNKKQFEEYVINFSVPTPYVNTQYVASDAFSWNYVLSVITTPPHGGTGKNAACWQQLYTNWYNTPYPHLEPWALQGYKNKPMWWDAEYLETNRSRVWIYDHSTTTGMWENIRVGIVPVGKLLPSGIISTGVPNEVRTYNYVPVNISDGIISGGYASDQLLPPYYEDLASGIRSIFDQLVQVVSPSSDYTFGDDSVIEWQWKTSAGYVVKDAIIAFQMEPARFLRAAFGPKYSTIDNLEFDILFKKVYSHREALFHGDLYKTNQLYSVNGINQWYVNYNRFTGYNTSTEFRDYWVNWTPLLTYQTNNTIDTNAITVGTKNFDMSAQDYRVSLINNGVIKDLWCEAFNIKLLSIPPAIIQYNNQSKWKLELDSVASVAREISYYGVKEYPFICDTASNLCYIYRYTIIHVDVPNKRFFVSENQSDTFKFGTHITVANSTNNNGSYVVLSSVYDPTNNVTRINVNESIASNVIDGNINVDGFTLPWSTGDMVVFNTTKFLPTPLVPNTPYYIISSNDSQSFYLAETYNDSLNNIHIDIKTIGVGIHRLAEIYTSFKVFGGTSSSQDVWYHYAIDKNVIKTFVPPLVINGMQSLINIIDGYVEYQKDSGLIFGQSDSNDFDPDTGRLVEWGLELERFIDWAYNLKRVRLDVSDRFEFVVNTTTNTLQFIDSNPNWVNGTAIKVSTTGSLPTPLNADDTYYVYNTGDVGIIKLSTSRDVNYLPYHVDLTSAGSGHLFTAVKTGNVNYPQFELNPIRNNIWLDTPKGVLSNIISGPYTDIRIRQTLFDQYGRSLDASKLLIYRLDRRSRVNILPQLQNDFDKFYVGDPYNYLHLGGGHFFVEGYEHFILFNAYTFDGALVYDSFLGLSTNRIKLDFVRNAEHTLRPVLGGYHLKGNDFARNIEGAASDLRTLYDTYTGLENSSVLRLSRAILGYNHKTDFLDNLTVNPKSQFLFYRGMINTKGTVSSINAFTNSKRFVDISVDDFWAIKVAEFGDNRPKVAPEIMLLAEDGIIDDIRLEFVGLEDDIFSPRIQKAVNEKGFKLVTFSDDTRWNNFPEQRDVLKQPLFLDAEVEDVVRLFVSSISPTKVYISDIDYWYDTSDNTLKQWTGSDWGNIIYNRLHISAGYVDDNNVTIPSYVYWKHDSPCDDVRIVRRDVSDTKQTFSIIESDNVNNTFTIFGDIRHQFIGTIIFTVTGSPNNNRTYTIDHITFDSLNNITTLFTIENVQQNNTGGIINIYSQLDILNSYAADDESEKANSFVVRGNVTNQIYVSSDITIFNSPNAGAYTVQQSIYNSSQNITILYVLQPVLVSSSNGVLTYNYFNFTLYNSVFFKPGETAANTYHKLNNEVVRILRSDFYDILHIYKVKPAINKINPVRLVNKSDRTTLDRITMWHPAYGVHHNQSLKYIDIISDKDPALYSSDTEVFWNHSEVGKIWFDTSKTSYVPYYDETIYPDINDRLKLWGKLSSYGDIKVYQWVRSTVLPTEWNALAVKQQGDLTIPQAERVTGRVKSSIFKQTRVVASGELYFGSDTHVKTSLISFKNNDNVFFVAESELPTDFQDHNIFNVSDINSTTPQTFKLTTVVNDIETNVLANQTETCTVKNIGTSTVKLFRFQVKAHFLANGDYIKFSTVAGGTLPSGAPSINGSTVYKVVNVTTSTDSSYQLFDITTINNVPIVINNVGVGELTINVVMKNVKIVQIFDFQPWIKQSIVTDRLIGAWFTNATASNITLNWKNIDDKWLDGDEVDIHINGAFINTGTIQVVDNNVTLDTNNLNVTFNVHDYIDIVKPIPDISTLITDVPIDTDDGSVSVRWKEDFEFSTQSIYINGNTFTNYYFWVEDSTVQSRTITSLREITSSLLNNPDPYMVVQTPLDSISQIKGYGYDEHEYGVLWSMGEIPEFFVTIPIMYREAIIRNITNIVFNNNDYMIQFTRNWTLRDDTAKNSSAPSLKNKHAEWIMFRRGQFDKISISLWNKVIESLSGKSLNGSFPVPSLDRVLYDEKHNTDTRYGLESGQAFVNKQLGLATVLNYLQSTSRDFSPIDIDEFFVRHSFSSVDDIIAALTEIYDTFNAEHVNNIWFDLLEDALTTKSSYSNLMKTSWVAIQGTQVLDVNGQFNL